MYADDDVLVELAVGSDLHMMDAEDDDVFVGDPINRAQGRHRRCIGRRTPKPANRSGDFCAWVVRDRSYPVADIPGESSQRCVFGLADCRWTVQNATAKLEKDHCRLESDTSALPVTTWGYFTIRDQRIMAARCANPVGQRCKYMQD